MNHMYEGVGGLHLQHNKTRRLDLKALIILYNTQIVLSMKISTSYSTIRSNSVIRVGNSSRDMSVGEKHNTENSSSFLTL